MESSSSLGIVVAALFVGLIPPLVIRYVVRTDPMDKVAAFVTAAILWVVNLSLFKVIVGELTPGGTLALVAAAT